MTASETFTDELEHWLRGDEAKTLGSLGEVFAERSFAATILLLMFVPALPLPTGGITHVFEAITVVISAQMILGRRTMWRPARWKRRELGALTTDRALPFIVRWVRRCERFSRPRGVALFRHDWSRRLLGLLLMGLAIAAALAPPFSGLDTLPAMGAVDRAVHHPRGRRGPRRRRGPRHRRHPHHRHDRRRARAPGARPLVSPPGGCAGLPPLTPVGGPSGCTGDTHRRARAPLGTFGRGHSGPPTLSTT